MAAVATVSIIIPTYKEAATIGALLDYLERATAGESGLEIIVADGAAPTTPGSGHFGPA